MACMENFCKRCRHVWFDNQLQTRCPECGQKEKDLNGQRMIQRTMDEDFSGDEDHGEI